MGQASFTLTCIGTKRLEIACDSGHRFVFDIVPEDRRAPLLIRGAHWKDQFQPPDSTEVLADASRFASVCAEDFGLP